MSEVFDFGSLPTLETNHLLLRQLRSNSDLTALEGRAGTTTCGSSACSALIGTNDRPAQSPLLDRLRIWADRSRTGGMMSHMRREIRKNKRHPEQGCGRDPVCQRFGSARDHRPWSWLC